ncbi:adenylate/guanylate cyclase domain-containing protein [Flavihumibacter petaseus]|uniref:Putative adenylate cyclase n=1 Tax=Flavihumibacter petaseus NBRC 106054 TaxID=1220578 RepID=A0A0E9MYE8_9BACT|nr:adenylate/guanylate cyclase domain-containing protein [Flavihumibacter petaseus]GAO42528.1 putative adenylate cyclase [Flavihumibacter petaseus NBRC 106054]
MAPIQLKNIIHRRHAASAKLLSLIERMGIPVNVEDLAGTSLLAVDPLPGGTPFPDNTSRFPICCDEETIGWVNGNPQAQLVAALISLFADKEAERKKVGNEVLSLYREVNQIFNFSEKLAQSIGLNAIAMTTLEEAQRVIPYDRAAIVLWNETTQQLELAAGRGEFFPEGEDLNQHLDALVRIFKSGQSEIIDSSHPEWSANLVPPEVQTILYAALKVKHRVMGAVILAAHQSPAFTASDLKLLVTFALQCSASIENSLLYEKSIREAQEREQAMRRVYQAAEKFVPYAFIGSLGHERITDVKLGDQVEKVVTVLFTDIRSFATLSEKMTPEDNFGFICSFNEKMGPIIRKHNGFINQYLGDAIMAIFPLVPQDAIEAALEMQQAVADLNSRRHEKNYPHIQIGIGMHTGPLIMGITGDDERLDAATISDTVNTASRIESLTKYYKADILVTEACARGIETDAPFHLRPLGKVQVKGKKESIGIFDCFIAEPSAHIAEQPRRSSYPEPPSATAPAETSGVSSNGTRTDIAQPKKLATLELFNHAINSYLHRSFTNAFLSFQQVIEQNPDDLTAHFFLGKTAKYISTGVPDDWDGVEEMWEK